MAAKIIFGLLVLAFSVASCALNPATGGRDFVLLSEQEEIRMGRVSHQQIMQQYQRYDDEDLQQYVQQIGERLAAVSDRKNLVYRFTVLDSAEVNAFALPGGYIYITRGLLAYLGSEAELAAVLGHEIGHVTARHSVRRISTARAADLGMTLGSIFIPELRTQGARSLYQLLSSAITRGYGREHELEADRLGAEYLARGAYSPQAMIDVIGVLKAQEQFSQQLAAEQGRKSSAYHGVFATHPDNDLRLQEVIKKADVLVLKGVVVENKAVFLQHLDGLVFGDGVEEGVRRGNHFYHRKLGITLAFPQGWSIKNTRNAVQASAKNNEAQISFFVEDINQHISPEQFMRQRLHVKEIEQGQEVSPDGLRAYTGVVKKKTGGKARISVIYSDNKAFILVGQVKKAQHFSAHDHYFLEVVNGFHRLTEQEMELSQPLRLLVRKIVQQDSFSDMAATSMITDHAEEQLRLLNGLYPDGALTVGQLFKEVR